MDLHRALKIQPIRKAVAYLTVLHPTFHHARARSIDCVAHCIFYGMEQKVSTLKIVITTIKRTEG